MKKFILGFIVGTILFSLVPAYAETTDYLLKVANYKVMINGKEYKDEQLPILNYQGNTYAPIKSILSASGLNINWNAELKQAEITQKGILNNMNENTSDGLKIYNINNINYVAMKDVVDKYNNYTYGRSKTGDTMVLKLKTNENEIITDLQFTIYEGRTFIIVEYYENVVLPLID